MRRGSVHQRHKSSCPKTPEGKWAPHKCRGPWSFYLLSGRRPDGKRRQITRSGFSTKREAETALEEALAREEAGVGDVHGVKVGTFLHQWLDGKRALRDTTRRGYEIHLRRYLVPNIGGMRLSDLRPHHLDVLYADLLNDQSNSMTATTIRHIHATLRSALNTAVKRRLIPWNPAEHVELPERSRPTTSVWTPEQLGAFLDSIADHRLYAYFHLVAFAGLRRGEALGLAWEDIDFDHGLIRVRQQLVDAGRGAYLGPPKTRSGIGRVPVDAFTLDVLQAHAQSQGEERARWGHAWENTRLVFTREDGTAFRPEYLTHLFKRLVAAASLPRIRLHDLRHTSASLALAAGVPIKVVSDRLGHSSTAITSDLYTHVIPVVAQEAADSLAALIPLRATRPTDLARQPSSEDLANRSDQEGPSQ
ncbi:MAG TPA: site-specific integrase [Nocardioidaceae bacterium]|nr:site-specific integrase [Nocardioidaceae bacterium]